MADGDGGPLRWRRCLAAVALLCLAAAPPHYPTHQPAPPRLQAKAIGPTMIQVRAELSDPAYQVALVRSGSDGSEWQSWISRGIMYQGRRGETTDPARAATTYTYRAQAESGNAAIPNSSWSDPVTVTTPPEPSAPPPPPTRLRGRAVSPFDVELSWKEQGDTAYGFEVQKQAGDDFMRVALVDPQHRSFVHHGRRAGERNTYRVRAFNPRGTTAFTDEVTVRTPTSVPLPRQSQRAAASPCTTRERVEAELAAQGQTDWQHYALQLKMGTHQVDLFPTLDCCGAQNGHYRAFGTYAGCYRELGDLAMILDGSFDQLAVAADGWPVIRTLTHWQCGRGAALTYQFVRGRFVLVGKYLYCTGCGDEESELQAAAPPFCAACADSAGYEVDVCQTD